MLALLPPAKRVSPNGSRQPSGGSSLDIRNRCAVFQGVATDGASIDRSRRDANGRRWLARPASARLATVTTSGARSATAGGQMGEIVGSTVRVRPTGGAGPDIRVAGLGGSPRRVESLRRSERRGAFARRMARYCGQVNGFYPGRDIWRGTGFAASCRSALDPIHTRARSDRPNVPQRKQVP
jgi:hypothetical protein